VRRHLGFFGLVLLAALAFVFPGLLFRGEVLFERDLHQMLYGQYASIARIVGSGSWPTWDPWPGFGQPLLANPAAQILYPPTWLCLILAPGHAYTGYLLLHLAAGAFATRALARRLGASPLAAAGAGLLWMLSGPVLSLANLWHHLAGASLMPLVWLAACEVRREPVLRRAVVGGGALGLQMLAGSFDMCVLTLAVVAGWWLVTSRDHATPPGRRGTWLALLVAGGVAASLAAGLAVPLLDLWRASARTALGESMRTYWSLHPLLLLQVAVPLFPHRLALAPDTWAQMYEGREPFVASVYLGLVTLPLVAAGLVPRPRRLAIFLACAIALAALIALGRHGLLYPVLVEAVPALRSLRYPSKATVALPLLWALLAARGIDALREPARGWRSRGPALATGAAAVVVATVIAAVLVWAPPAWLVFPAATSSTGGEAALAAKAAGSVLVAAGLGLASLPLLLRDGLHLARGAALLCLAGIDLGVAHRGLNETAPFVLFATPPAVLSKLPAASEGGTRVHSWDYLARVLGKPYRRVEPAIPAPTAPADVPPALAAALARRDFLSPPIAAEFALRGSFDRDWLGLQPRGVRNLGLVFQAKEETPEALRLLRLGGVAYVVALHREGLEALVPVATVRSPFAGDVHVLRVPDPMPLAYAVGGTRVADGVDALRLLAAPDFDPGSEVLLPYGRESRGPGSFTAEVRLTEVRADRLAVEVTLSAEGYLVLLEAWDSGWRAFVDGRETTAHRANVGFVAVAVPGGAHRAEIVYRPRGLGVGLAATTCAAALVLGALVWPPSRPRGGAAGPEKAARPS
jgi:hypothetical protein